MIDIPAISIDVAYLPTYVLLFLIFDFSKFSFNFFDTIYNSSRGVAPKLLTITAILSPDFNLESFDSNSIIAPKIQETSSVHLLRCIFYEKFSLQKECKYNNLPDETKQELLKRFYKPFYIPVIALLCSFLLISGNYKPNYSIVKKYIFLTILFVLIISEASLRYSTKSSFSMIVYFLIPLLLFLSFYISIHKKIKNA